MAARVHGPAGIHADGVLLRRLWPVEFRRRPRTDKHRCVSVCCECNDRMADVGGGTGGDDGGCGNWWCIAVSGGAVAIARIARGEDRHNRQMGKSETVRISRGEERQNFRVLEEQINDCRSFRSQKRKF
ncbi:phage tail tape measure protein [Striga asiatica]|uniref:Phage tail tape measure protein n=1 Tax=Striga asiatica TaxID=4170 RepID=A0A5A7R2F1_STRAF|nr:phage tail tape measure protein [Striga asiatica]